MGLDMYLYATKYVSNWSHSEQQEKDLYTRLAAAIGVQSGDLKHLDGQALTIQLKVAYWRKANSIHKWFVETCQDGTDDCRDAHVSREQLTELLRLCKEVLATVETVDGQVRQSTTYHPDGRVEDNMVPGRVVAQTAIAERVLPTQDGFFFGSTEYDEYYLDDLKSTVDQLDAVLNNPKFSDFDFEYHSSW